MMTSPIKRLTKAALVALLVESTAAGAHPEFPQLADLPRPRALYLSKNPRHEVPAVYVAGGVVTTLRFETPCDPGQTRLLGWEGYFEPLLVGGRSVVLVPLKDLDPEDRFRLLVTLQDGTLLPFTVTASKALKDAQVNVYPNPSSPEALRETLEEKRKENRALREENRRREKEETSIDHALAALLANGEVSLTPFKEKQKWTSKDEGLHADILIYEGPERLAVLFLMKNLDPKKPWKLEEARLSTFTTREPRPLALRMTPTEIPPGGTGRIALITSQSSFDTPAGKDKLVVELFRDGGLRQGYVVVELRPQR